MNPKTKTILITFIALCFLCIFVPLDFVRILVYPDTYHVSFEIVIMLKLMVSFLAFLMAITSDESVISKSDYYRISISFCIIFWGDIFFTMQKTVLGVLTFAIGQLFLIYRNSNGIKEYFKEHFKRDKHFIILSAIVIFIIDITLLVLLFFRTAGVNGTTIGFSIYSITLCLSVWVGQLTRKIGYFSKSNAIKISIGMILFFLCDLSVGYGIIIDDVIIKDIVTSSTWIFYTPALLLLSLSSYNFKR